MVEVESAKDAQGGTRKTTFLKWVPATDERGGDVEASPRGAEGCPYELVEEADSKEGG